MFGNNTPVQKNSTKFSSYQCRFLPTIWNQILPNETDFSSFISVNCSLAPKQ